MAVAYGASGTQGQGAGDTTLTPSYPSSPPAGALFLLRFGHNNNATQASASYTVPAGWTARYTAEVSQNTRQWVYTRDAAATGSESGTISITVSSGTSAATHAAQIDYFTGADVSSPIDASAASFENAGIDPCTDGDLTTATDGAMACQACIHAGAFDIATLSGGTGGTYTNQTGGGGASTPRIGIQTAPIATAGSIGGFSYNKGAGGRWGIRGFAVKPAAAAGQPAVKRMGGVPFASPNRGIW